MSMSGARRPVGTAYVRLPTLTSGDNASGDNAPLDYCSVPIYPGDGPPEIKERVGKKLGGAVSLSQATITYRYYRPSEQVG